MGLLHESAYGLSFVISCLYRENNIARILMPYPIWWWWWFASLRRCLLYCVSWLVWARSHLSQVLLKRSLFWQERYSSFNQIEPWCSVHYEVGACHLHIIFNRNAFCWLPNIIVHCALPLFHCHLVPSDCVNWVSRLAVPLVSVYSSVHFGMSLFLARSLAIDCGWHLSLKAPRGLVDNSWLIEDCQFDQFFNFAVSHKYT